MVEKSMPVLVGVGQVTEREFDVDSSSVLDLVEQAVYKAADFECAGIYANINLGNIFVPAVLLSFDNRDVFIESKNGGVINRILLLAS